MDYLYLLPLAALIILVARLIWSPVKRAVQSAQRKSRRKGLEPEDRLAESLFDTWNEHGDNPGLVVRGQAPERS